MSSGLNGETVMKRENVFLGMVDGGSYGYKRNLRVTVDVRMERLDRQAQYETTSHRMVARPLDFAITTSVWRPDRRDVVSGGATVEPLTKLVSYAPGVTQEMVADLIDAAKWHLNSVNAACDHQDPAQRDCPVTGYKYGHAWLVRELPDGFQQRIERDLPR